MKTRALFIGALSGLMAAGCQTYDFEPVEPLAVAQARKQDTAFGRLRTPNLMLLVDKSGSMNIPTDVSDPDCSAQCKAGTALCGAGCATRWTDLQAAMNQFLTQSGQIARMGLMTFPNGAVCEVANAPRIDLPTTDEPGVLQEKAKEINATLAGISMALSGTAASGQPNSTGGGTPTGNSLKALINYTQLFDPDRKDFILLLTDGLPNCNPDNPISGSDAAACVCQVGGGSGCTGQFSKLGCLDATATVQQIAELKELDVETVVVGFGIDTSGASVARDTLQRMAQAGGFPRACPNGTDAECGTGNSCNVTSKECTNKFYAAQNATELANALRQISEVVNQNFCEYTLDITPEGEEFISVLIDDQATPRGDNTWTYDSVANRVLLQGALCDRIKAAREDQPIAVEIRVIQSL